MHPLELALLALLVTLAAALFVGLALWTVLYAAWRLALWAVARRARSGGPPKERSRVKSTLGIKILSATAPGRCGYCHDSDAAPLEPCPACQTALHDGCWLEVKSCPTFGCTARIRAAAA